MVCTVHTIDAPALFAILNIACIIIIEIICFFRCSIGDTMTSLPYTLPSLDASTLRYLAECSKNYALMNGVIKRVEGSLDSSEVATYIPHTLFPSPLPRKLYNLANEMQESINELVLRVANDKEFLTTALKRFVFYTSNFSRIIQIHLLCFLVLKYGR